jgi:hypothetical protein
LGQLKVPGPCLVFSSVLYVGDIQADQLLNIFEGEFGAAFSFTHPYFPMKKYYAKEMGEDLKRLFIVSKASFKRGQWIALKKKCLEWEELSIGEGESNTRRANWDLGELALENVVLTTAKSYAHRLYFGEGVYGELTYQCQDGEFRSLPWTYPDYADDEIRQRFDWFRSYLLEITSRPPSP